MTYLVLRMWEAEVIEESTSWCRQNLADNMNDFRRRLHVWLLMRAVM